MRRGFLHVTLSEAKGLLFRDVEMLRFAQHDRNGLCAPSALSAPLR
jgi:hypothetical protein